MLSHDQRGDPNRELPLSLHPAGILSQDRRVAAAVLQHSTGCGGVVVAAAVVAVTAAAVVVTAVTTAADDVVTAVDAAVTVADLQWRHGTGIKGVGGGRPPLAADFAKVSSF